ncbi:MAG: methylated-DNA--[protein]-cysteine S-methyltransferase [Coriobacteriales bacterium]|jgi:methylated-DNA-[protein]-cysteine S-methyltransferase|nr:methylated-DNA--[protein]-cysteine S-methyltransferase [Coriobacteriales bacterium]
MQYGMEYDSPVGLLTVASDGDNITGLWIAGQRYHCAGVSEPLVPHHNLPIFDAARHWLDRYFAGESPAISELPLAPVGGQFRQGVWEILKEIPYGEVTTYGSIATQMAERTGKTKMSARAVGGAVGHNPISIIIPCHRVIGSGGNLTGYGGGIAKKIKLLALEGIDTSHMRIPTKGTAL